MTLCETTRSMIDNMPDTDVKVSYNVTKSLFDKNSSPYKPVNENQVLKDLELSRSQIQTGQYKDLNDALDKIDKKYGL